MWEWKWAWARKASQQERAAALRAARLGNAASLRVFLEAGGNPNLREESSHQEGGSSSSGLTLLHLVCRSGSANSLVAVQALLTGGAEPSARGGAMGEMPLHLAAEGGHLGAVQLLVSSGATVNGSDAAQVTPLHVAAQVGSIEIARLLLSKGANPDCAEQDGWTSLHFACLMGNAGMVRLLLHSQADVDLVESVDGNSPLHVACAVGALPCVNLLLDAGATVDVCNSNGQLPEDCTCRGIASLDFNQRRALRNRIQERREKRAGGKEYDGVVDELFRLKEHVTDVEGQLLRSKIAARELAAFVQDRDSRLFKAALRPECVLCQTYVKSVALEPCQHLCVCEQCAAELDACPFCQSPVAPRQQSSSPSPMPVPDAPEVEEEVSLCDDGSCSAIFNSPPPRSSPRWKHTKASPMDHHPRSPLHGTFTVGGG
jgi:hypothetical protein